MGHMSFLRTERILNRFLTANDIEKKGYCPLLMTKLKKNALLVGKNKLIAAPTNADTILMDNYQHDIYVDTATPLNKVNSIINNVTEIMKLEMFCASSVLADTYPGAPQLFANSQMETPYKKLEKALSS